MANPNAPVETLKQVLTSIAQKREEYEKLTQNRNSIDMQIERAEKALSSLRTQLIAELRKFDPDLRLAEAAVLEDAHA